MNFYTFNEAFSQMLSFFVMDIVSCLLVNVSKF